MTQFQGMNDTPAAQAGWGGPPPACLGDDAPRNAPLKPETACSKNVYILPENYSILPPHYTLKFKRLFDFQVITYSGFVDRVCVLVIGITVCRLLLCNRYLGNRYTLYLFVWSGVLLERSVGWLTFLWARWKTWSRSVTGLNHPANIQTQLPCESLKGCWSFGLF